ncbi:MAG: transcription elongation factor NusA, partial [bacterium]|nr:transcription elongation factor NusA [bacterium]
VLDEAGHRATVTVSEDEQSLAIGRGGQNVRLAAKLTGWNIDIVSAGGAEIITEEAEQVTILPAEEELTVLPASDETVADASEDRDKAKDE